MLARFIGYDQRLLCFLVFVYKTAKLEYVKTIKAFKGGQAELALAARIWVRWRAGWRISRSWGRR